MNDEIAASDNRLPFKLMLFVLVDGWQLLWGRWPKAFTVRGASSCESVMMMGTGR